MFFWDFCSVVYESEDYFVECLCDFLDVDFEVRVCWLFVVYNSLDGNVEEEKCGDEFGDFSFLERLVVKFGVIEEWCYGWFCVVFFGDWCMCV